MGDFRTDYMQKFPDTKKVADVAKAGAAKWALLTPDDKKPYDEQAKVRKEEYEAAKAAYEASK